MLAAGFGAELKLSWTDLQCPVYQGPGVSNAGGGHRTVGIIVVDAKGGRAATVTWGRSATIQIRGVPYVVSANDGWVLADGSGCGTPCHSLRLRS